jgi:predicted PurR-regulated permease PerM
VFIGVLGGHGFGAIGLFMGPVVLALAVALIQFIVEARRERAPPAPSVDTPSLDN